MEKIISTFTEHKNHILEQRMPIKPNLTFSTIRPHNSLSVVKPGMVRFFGYTLFVDNTQFNSKSKELTTMDSSFDKYTTQ